MSDNLPPQDIDAEKVVIGSLMQDVSAIDELTLTPADFYSERHGRIFAAMQELHASGQPVDYVTVTAALGRAGDREDGYLLELVTTVPSTLAVYGAAPIVRGTATRRRLLATASHIAQLAHSDKMPVSEVISKAQESVEQAAAGYVDHLERGESADTISQALATEAVMRNTSPAQVLGLPSGLKDLDSATDGLPVSELTLVAARTGMGKSSLLANITWGAAKAGYSVLVFSLEMNRLSFMRRVACQMARVSNTGVRRGMLNNIEFSHYQKTLDELAALPIKVIDGSGYTVRDMRAMARRHQRKAGLNAVIVDTMNRAGDVIAGGNQYQGMTNASHALADWAHESDLAIVTAVQLSRMVEQTNDKRPSLHMLRDSGALEEDATLILGMMRPAYYNEEADKHAAILYVLKNREGPSSFAQDVYYDESWPGFCDLDRTTISLDDALPVVAGRDDRQAAR